MVLTSWRSSFQFCITKLSLTNISRIQRFSRQTVTTDLVSAGAMHHRHHGNAFSSYLSLPCNHLAPVWSTSWEGLIWFWLCHSSLGSRGGTELTTTEKLQTANKLFKTDMFFFCWQFVESQRKMQWELGCGTNTRFKHVRFYTWVLGLKEAL